LRILSHWTRFSYADQLFASAIFYVLRSAKSFTSRKIVFFVVWPKFAKFTRNACGMVLLSSSWVCCQTENKSIRAI